VKGDEGYKAPHRKGRGDLVGEILTQLDGAVTTSPACTPTRQLKADKKACVAVHQSDSPNRKEAVILLGSRTFGETSHIDCNA